MTRADALYGSAAIALAAAVIGCLVWGYFECVRLDKTTIDPNWVLVDCPECNGTGVVMCPLCHGVGCNACEGPGEIYGCPFCEDGMLAEEKTESGGRILRSKH